MAILTPLISTARSGPLGSPQILSPIPSYHAGDTYLVPSRQTLWPQLADSGSVTHTGDSAAIFGAAQKLTSGNSLVFNNCFMGPGDAVKLLYFQNTGFGTATITHAGDSVGALSTAGTLTKNVVGSVTDSVKSQLSLGALTITATGGDLYLQQIQIVAAENRTSTDPDMLPWRIDVPPAAYDFASGSVTIAQTTQSRWGSHLYGPSTLNNRFDYLIWLPSGDFTFFLEFAASASRGIVSYYLDSIDPGSKIGEIDQYSGTTSYLANLSFTFTNGTTGLRRLIAIVESKNASSSGYVQSPIWMQFRRTS